MHKIVYKAELAPNTVMFKVEAPWIARKIRPGQFVIVRLDEKGERIPLSISGWDPEAGTLRLVVQGVGYTSHKMIRLEVGDTILDVVGPLGRPTHLPEGGTAVVIGGGYGTGAVIPSALEQRAHGRRVVGIVGARSENLLLLVDDLRAACDEVFVTTDDGSAGRKGLVTDALRDIIEQEDVGAVLAIGPVPMMRAVAEMTRPKNIPTMVSLNAIMVDGTGMCGACRVTVGGTIKFACYDGPDFDGHLVDYQELMMRQRTYKKQEAEAMEVFKREFAPETPQA
jgi:ferredoxin--NADP+ reductase